MIVSIIKKVEAIQLLKLSNNRGKALGPVLTSFVS